MKFIRSNKLLTCLILGEIIILLIVDKLAAIYYLNRDHLVLLLLVVGFFIGNIAFYNMTHFEQKKK